MLHKNTSPSFSLELAETKCAPVSSFPSSHHRPLLLQEDIAEMKRKMKTMNNQVTRLRDEITGKEQALAKEQQEYKRLEKDNESLKVHCPFQ